MSSQLGRTFAAIVCSVLLSTACVLGAVGPATGGSAVAVATELTA